MKQRTLRTDSASIVIDAPAETIYDLVADVTRMGDWSPECRRCEWIEDATGPTVGARFRAYNRRGWMRWSNSPVVIVAERGREFAFSRRATGAGEYVWRYTFEPGAHASTTVTESYEAVRPETWLVSTMARLFTPGTEAAHLRRAMETTLRQLKEHAEGPARDDPRSGP